MNLAEAFLYTMCGVMGAVCVYLYIQLKGD